MACPGAWLRSREHKMSKATARQRPEGGHLARLGRHTAGADQGRVRVHGTYIQTRRVTCDAPIASSRSDAVSIITCARWFLPTPPRVPDEEFERPDMKTATNELFSGGETALRQGERNMLAGK